jgi:hypothetical protein
MAGVYHTMRLAHSKETQFIKLLQSYYGQIRDVHLFGHFSKILLVKLGVFFQHVFNTQYLLCVINSSHTSGEMKTVSLRQSLSLGFLLVGGPQSRTDTCQTLHICYGHVDDFESV